VTFKRHRLLRKSVRSPGVDGISDAANRIIRTGGRVDIPALAGRAGISTCQFARKFIRHVGVRPKLFARIAKFEAARENKAGFLAKSWTDIAHEFGYYIWFTILGSSLAELRARS
jgi:AraC-like DNA-binding protein